MQRRDFLETSLAVGTGLLLHAQAAAQPLADRPLRVALVGVGIQGRNLLNAAVKIPGLQFCAVVDIWPYARRLATYLLKRYGHEAKEYDDYREMLDQQGGDLDAVVIATPDCHHAEQSIACMKAGLHVYCERPMAHSLGAATTMLATATESDRLLQIGYQRRSNPRYLHVRHRLLDEARLFGRVVRAQCQWYEPVRDDFGWPSRFALEDAVLQKYGYQDMHQFRNWRNFTQFGAGGSTALAAPHIDAVGWLLQVNPRSVTAVGGRDYYDSRQSLDNITALVDYDTDEGSLRAEYRVLTMTSGDGVRSCQHLLGTDGSIRMSENPRWTAIYREPHVPDWNSWVERGLLKSTKQSEPSAPMTSQEAHVRETGVIVPFELPVVMDQAQHQPHLENFFLAVRGEANLRCPASSAMTTEAVMHAISQAVKLEAKVPIEQDLTRN